MYEANTWLWNFGQPQPEPSVASLSVAKTEKICKRSQCRGAAAKSAWKTRARQAPKSAAEADADIWHVYSCHIPVISTRSVKDDLSALVSVHMLRMCLWHAWSDVCWLFHCFFDCLKALNENCTYGRHIPLQINHMSDIICYNDFSTVTAELIIFLLFKLQYTNAHDLSSGILYTWYKAVHDGMYWYVPVRTLLGTWRYEKPQNGTYQYVPT